MIHKFKSDDRFYQIKITDYFRYQEVRLRSWNKRKQQKWLPNERMSGGETQIRRTEVSWLPDFCRVVVELFRQRVILMRGESSNPFIV